MPRTAPSNRPAKGQPKPRKWKVARDAARQQAQKPKVKAPSRLQVAQATERDKLRKLGKAERLERYRQIQDLRTRAVQAGLIEHGLDPIQVLQRLIDDGFIDYMLARQEYDSFVASNETEQIKNLEHPLLKETRRLERRMLAYRREAAYLSGLSVQYNLQDRQTRVAEARIQLFMQALQQTLRHPDINLSPDKVKLIPRIMKEKLMNLRADEKDS